MKRLFSLFVFLTFAQVAGAGEFIQIKQAKEFSEVIDGKTLVRPLIKLRVSTAGEIVGTGAKLAVTGNWKWIDGYFCRDLFWGKRELGYNCQAVAVNGNTIRFQSDKGTGDFADFDLR